MQILGTVLKLLFSIKEFDIEMQIWPFTNDCVSKKNLIVTQLAREP